MEFIAGLNNIHSVKCLTVFQYIKTHASRSVKKTDATVIQIPKKCFYS